MLSFYEQQSYFSQFFSKKAKITIYFFVKNSKNNNIVLGFSFMYCTCAIITRGLCTFYPLFEVHLCTVTFGLMYG